MGLDFSIKGVKNDDCLHCSYLGFYLLRREIVKAYYGEKMHEIYIKDNATEKEIEYWNKHCNDDLDILLMHSDCDGKLTPKESGKIYAVIKDLEFDTDNPCERQFNIFKNNLLHSKKHRVNIYFR